MFPCSKTTQQESGITCLIFEDRSRIMLSFIKTKHSGKQEPFGHSV